VNRISILDADNTECTLVGDAQAYVLAGLPAGVTVIGYANKPGKAGAVASVQAAAVSTDLAAITTTLRLAPLESPDHCRTGPYWYQAAPGSLHTGHPRPSTDYLDAREVPAFMRRETRARRALT